MIQNRGKGFLNKDILISLEGLQLLYCVYQSDEFFIKNIFDSELYELDIILDEFYEIYFNMRPTNVIKTNYLFSKLLKTAENTLTNFLNRYPNIKKVYLKINPESGEEYLEL